MTWASNVGELGVRDILIEMEAELEGINTALNTPSAFPGEVRMFVGKVPPGWAEISRKYSPNLAPHSFAWSAGPPVSNGANNTSSGGDHKGVVRVGDDRVLVAGDFAASLSSAPVSTTMRIRTLADGGEVYSGSIVLTRPAIFSRMSNGAALLAGGIRSTTASSPPSTTVVSIDPHGVQTVLAPLPEAAAGGVSGVLPDGRHAVFGIRNGANGSTATVKCLAYSEGANVWEYLPDLPSALSYSGVVVVVNGRIFLIGRGAVARVYEYLPAGPTHYVPVTVVFPEGITGCSGAISSAYLDDGRVALYVTGVSFGGAAPTSQQRIFAFDGTVFENLADLPPLLFYGSTSARLANAIADAGGPAAAGAFLLIADTPGGSSTLSQSYLLPSQSAGYLALRAIKYARKLP